MQIKKNPKANLEKRRAIHIQVGLIIALSFVLISLEWGTREATREDNGEGIDWKFPNDEPEATVPVPIDQALVEFPPEFPGGEKEMMK